MITFGPVPSRRLGRSLGINNIPPKHCTYSCLYCQVGSKGKMHSGRMEFYPPGKIAEAVGSRREALSEQGERIDYLTFVPDGEPTLDLNLGLEIAALQPAGFRTAVITNASLLWMADVRRDLMMADTVSVKVDTVFEKTWKKINRPHPGLCLGKILEGILEFSREYPGTLITETMLLRDLNEGMDRLQALARYLAMLKPETAYLAIPVRPPADKSVKIPAETAVNLAYQVFSGHLEHVEYLVGYEGNAFSTSGNAEKDLLAITAVHPMREEAVRDLLGRSGKDWQMVGHLLDRGLLQETEYCGSRYYLRKFSQPHN